MCGASSGIGRSLATVLASEGFDVVVLARREDRLVALTEQLGSRFGVHAEAIVADLANRDAPGAVIAELESRRKQIDFLVNNAGYSITGRFDTIDWDEHARHLQVMALTPIELTHRLLPGMIDRGWGRIITVSSIACEFTSSPFTTLYSGEKALLQRFSESLDAELKDVGVRCTVSVPGFTDTELTTKSISEESKNWMYDATLMSPDTVARQAFDAVMHGRPQIIHGLHHRALVTMMHHSPLPVRRAVSRAIYTMAE